ncbi:MAG TPA: calcium-binding protein, partial [Candidatus Caenarcaniphilales bacterium]
FGEQGNDKLDGGQDIDLLDGGAGKDTLLGGDGLDALLGREGDDKLLGQAGDDRLFGDFGKDTLAGGAGDDNLYGGKDSDRLTGGQGSDILIGGGGNDRLIGSQGRDYFAFNSPDQGIDTIQDFSLVDDYIQVSANGFGGGLTQGTGTVDVVLGVAATANSAQFIHNTRTGALLFDEDGIGGANAEQFATVRGVELRSVDFSVVV